MYMHDVRPLMFISIPRNASNLVHALLGLDRPKDTSLPSDLAILDNHATCDVLLGRYGIDEFSRRYKFCVVRNPWSRCISWFLHHMHLAPYRDLTFKQWIQAGMPHHWKVQNATEYGALRTPMNQYQFIADADRNLLVDYVARIERLDQDMQSVLEAVGISLPCQILPRINASPLPVQKQDYRKYFDDDTAEAVAKAMQTDIQMFRYKF